MTFTAARPVLIKLIVLALAACLALIVSGLAASQASAQAICTQYPDLPECQDDEDDDDDDDEGGDDDGGPGPSAGGGAADGDADGSLPFTGYPLTLLILLLLLLLAIGIAIRMYLAARERRQAAVADGIQRFQL